MRYYRLRELTGLAYQEAFQLVELFYKRSRFYNEDKETVEDIENFADNMGLLFGMGGEIRHGGEF